MGSRRTTAAFYSFPPNEASPGRFAGRRDAAEHDGVDMTETDWRQLGRRPSTGRTAEDRGEAAREAAAARRRRDEGGR